VSINIRNIGLGIEYQDKQYIHMSPSM